MRTISDELPLPDAPTPKGPHIIDRLAGFLTSKGMKPSGSKGLAANWFKQYGDKALEGALRCAEVAPNVGNYPAYIASILKGNAEDAGSSNDKTAGGSLVNGGSTPPPASRQIKPPPYRDTQRIAAEQRRMQEVWQHENEDRLDKLGEDARYKATRLFQRKAWLQAQLHLMGDPPKVPDLIAEEWESVSE